ncbi:ABC transporter ATP-binding protein [Cellulosilyticum sp. I15G10I2]|uniref:ABC transporter ATP-binding protein n=1 Tax=Cellulosilyticum sp. I15G10I2 TaxID=1892843 RepID=UPI000ACF1655|nr:ABC transporter ATP-binding protein [Cellulosilyticum sp. I15G10I2]
MGEQKKHREDASLHKGIPNIAGFGRSGGGPGGRFMRTVVKPKDFKGVMKRLWLYFKTAYKELIGIGVAVVLGSAMTLTVPFLIGKAIDLLSVTDTAINLYLLRMVVFLLLIVYSIDSMTSLLQGWIMAGISRRIVTKLRENLFLKLQKLPIAFFDTHTHGEMMSRLTNDIENVSTTISQSIAQLIAGGLTILGAFGMMVFLSPLLTLASIFTVPLVFLLSRTIASKTRVYFKTQQAELGRLNGYIEETITGMHIIRAFNHEKQVIENFSTINQQLFKAGLQAQILSGFLMPLMNVINNLGFVAVAGVGGMLAVNNIISVGVIASFLSYSRQFARPLNELANVFNTLQSAMAGAERIFEVLDEKEETEDKDEGIVLNFPKGDVVFKNVSFGYRKDVEVLKKISFEAKAGSSTALVGATGSGKTTIVNLLSRFYDTDQGEILIDGHNIKDYTRSSLRRCFGIVLQDTYLFTASIKENIRYGNLMASDKEVVRAAKMANADFFIKQLPRGYETVLAEGGNNLSEGQKQLLAIARAILADPAILILDEATSSVDTRTEIQIQEALLKLMQGRTSFIIAHRLSTIRDVDKIMVMDQGEIVESGSHNELVMKKGSYYNLYQRQYSISLIKSEIKRVDY